MRQSGCGPTSASLTMSYMAQKEPRLAPGLSRPLTRIRFAQYMCEIWNYVTPGRRGVNTLPHFSNGVLRYARDLGVELTSHSYDVPALCDRPKKWESFRDFLLEGLALDAPVAFLNLSSGKVAELDSWHWITLIGHIQESRFLALDNCKKLELDLKLWYGTAPLGGRARLFHLILIKKRTACPRGPF